MKKTRPAYMRQPVYAPPSLHDTTLIAMPQGKAARAIGVSSRTIRNWEKAGLLTGNRVGGIKLYPVDQLRKLAGIEPQQALP